MKGTIGGIDGDNNFWCRSCIEEDEIAEAAIPLRSLVKSYISTMTWAAFICNRCGKKVNNQPHLEEPAT